MKERANRKQLRLGIGLAVLLIAAVVMTVILILPKDNSSRELLENPGFEKGDTTGFWKYGTKSTAEISAEYAHSGQYGMLLHTRTRFQATYAQVIESVLTENGPGTYRASVWVKLREGTDTSGDCALVIEFQQNSGEEPQYFTSESKKLTDTWQEFVFEGTIDFDPSDGFRYAYIYQRSYDGSFNAPDVCIDDFSLIKTSKVNGVSASKTLSVNEHRPETSSVGAIRWDAFGAHNGLVSSTITLMEKSLSPAQFHFRAPFYSEVTEEGNIIFAKYDQETFDQEMEYAMDAGIDYFAYVWANDEKGQPRKYHTTSKYRNDVKLCICLHDTAICDDFTRQGMAETLTQDYYMTVLDGRPLLYFFLTDGTFLKIQEDIVYYRALAAELGLPDPYIVAMNTGSITTLQARKLDVDALSNYSVSGGGNMPFAELTEKAFAQWEEYRQAGVQYIPIVSTGWQPEPRYINPVPWGTTGKDAWAQYATPQEITDHLNYALAYLNHPDVVLQTEANTCIMYAWNEFDEGGWLCPTIAVDENGNQLYNEDGTPKINTEHILAAKEAIANYKNGILPEVSLNP